MNIYKQRDTLLVELGLLLILEKKSLKWHLIILMSIFPFLLAFRLLKMYFKLLFHESGIFFMILCYVVIHKITHLYYYIYKIHMYPNEIFI